jgi:hypothetical protein
MVLMRILKVILFFIFFIFFGIYPAGADFGNWFVANKRLATPLDSPNKKLSYRFTCQDDLSLIAAAAFCVDAVKSPAYLISLQVDEKGIPSGTPLTSNSYIPSAQKWTTIPLGATPLLKGKIYHLVIEPDILRGGGHPVGVVGSSNYSSFLSTDVLNHMHPNNGSPDMVADTLLYENGKWKELNQEPVYTIFGSGFEGQGNPYDSPGLRPIYGNPKDKARQVLQGQSLHFHCGFPASSLTFRVKKQGNPTSPLNYFILKNQFNLHKDTPVYKSIALTPDKAPSEFQWVTIGFQNDAFSNFSPECWFFVFQTDSGRSSQNPPGCEDCYLISDVGNSGGLAGAADFTFDGGPHLSRAVYSTDSGDPFHWMDDFERDANIGVIGHSCPNLGAMEFQPIPTPLPLNYDRRFQH